MSNSVDLQLVALALKEAKVPPAQAREVLEALNEKVSQAEADKPERAPRSKKQYVVVISDPEGQIKGDYTAWVVQLGEAESPFTTIERVNKTAHDFNASKRGRLIPVRNHADTFEVVPARFFKEHDLQVKTKLPVAVIKTDNRLNEAPSV